MESVNKEGLKSPTLGAEYICHYKGGLIGKHFKSLAQVMSYLVYDLVPKHVLDSWTVIGELVVLLWHTCIENVEEYLVSLSILSSLLVLTYHQAKLTHAINNFLTLSALCAPSILVTKVKFHFLVHLPAYIRRFGPAILFSTERYKSFNHVFWLS